MKGMSLATWNWFKRDKELFAPKLSKEELEEISILRAKAENREKNYIKIMVSPTIIKWHPKKGEVLP